MYDISNPSSPREMAHVNTTGYAPASQALCISGNYLYVASGNTGFYVCAIMPRLQVSLEGADLATISWPKPLAPGISVEHADKVSGGAWTALNGDPIYTNGNYVLKTPISGSGFFRLRISP